MSDAASRHVLKVKRTAPNAKLPEYAYPDDAGLDLTSIEDVTLEAGNRHLVRTGICVELPPNTEGQIRPRSGLAADYGVTVLNTPGTVDRGFRGEVRVLLVNLGTQTVSIKEGDKIAQLVVSPVIHVEVAEVSKLTGTARGTRGFGSSS